MASSYSDIARVLGGARRREGRIVLLTAGALGLSGAGLSALAGALALSRGLGSPAAVQRLALGGGALCLLAAAAWAGVALLRRASSPEATARFLGRAEPDLRSDLLSAVELWRDRDGLAAAGYSLALADAHVERTAARMGGVDLARALPSTPARRAGLVLGAVLLAHLLAVAVAGRSLGAGYAALAGLGPRPPAPPAEPITGDVELTYQYPAHTGRPPRTVSGTGGEITAPRGTEVRITARADRPVEEAELLLELAAPPPPPRKPGEGPAPGEPAQAGPAAPVVRAVALEVKDGRALAGRLMVEEPGTYRFRFRKGRRVLAEGPAMPIAVEPDAFPEVRITAPGPDVEVEGKARLRVDWAASDDFGLSRLTLVVKPAPGGEERRELRTFERARRESGSFELDVGGYRLGEGERLLYWLEVTDNDAISGPKKAASATQVVRIYSEAEHRRRMLEKAREQWEQMVRVLADHLELLDRSPGWNEERLAQAQVVDGRVRALHGSLRETAAALRRERGAPKAVAAALENAALGIRNAEVGLSAQRGTAVRMFRNIPPADAFWRRLAELDTALDRELEKDILYLESLFDKERAQDLVRLAKELQARRRDLASLLEKYKQAPSEEAKKQIVAEIQRMKQRMQEMARRMSELAKGIQDEHMNAEAFAEMQKQEKAMGGLDEVEKKLAAGDLEGAMKALDAMGSQMQDMLSSLERTAGRPDEKNQELAREMREFQKRLEEVEREQDKLAGETEKLRQEYRKKTAEKLQKMGEQAGKMEKLAREAREELQRGKEGLSPRAEEEFSQAKERLADAEKALKAQDFEAALDSVKRALPSMQRMAITLEDDAAMGERFPQGGVKPPAMLREAQKHALQAMQPAKKVRDELEQLFPDPRSVLSQGDQQKMEGLSKRQGEVEKQAGQLRQKLQELAEKAPVFPPQSQNMLGEAQGHMAQAQGELAQKNPQKGHGQQRQALDALGRFKKGLEEMAKKGGKGGSGGFPFPFAMGESGGREDGESGDPSQERVEIPGAEAYKVPEEFRRDILEAMKQGAPEPYRPELQRYYEELVK
jgi:hypothetical protein